MILLFVIVVYTFVLRGNLVEKIKISNCDNSRNISLDLIKVSAMLFVVMIHCSAIFVTGQIRSPFGFTIGNVFDSISRPGAPLFVMITGALMLNEKKEKTAKDMFGYAKNMGFLLVFWLMFYAAMYKIIFPIVQGESISIAAFVKEIVGGQGHTWYLYMLIGLYLTTPFLRIIVKKSNQKLVLLYIAFSLICTFINPLLNIGTNFFEKFSYITDFITKFNLDFFGNYITYYIAGWYIVHIGISEKYKKILYVLGMISLLIIFFVVQLTKDYANMYANDNIFVFFYTISVFLFVNNIELIANKKYKTILMIFSKLSFGVYMIHPLINRIIGYILGNLTNPIIHIPLRFIIVFSVSILLSYILYKIKFLKNLIRT